MEKHDPKKPAPQGRPGATKPETPGHPATPKK